jgi:CO/xanthine dehydrogenase Mo-binding subunit
MPRVVGTSARRKEGPEKLSGHARYVDDYRIPGCLHGVTLRSAFPHGRLIAIERDPTFDWDGFVVVTAADIPGRNVVTLIEQDQPLLADDEVRHAQEPIALVAHADRARAYAALDHFRVEYEALPALFDPERSDQVFKSFLVERGDVTAGLVAGDVVIEGEYQVPHQEHAYIENNAAAAWFEPDGTLVVLASMQCPYYVHKALKPMFDLPANKVRVVQAVTGGGFGGKEEYPNMIAGHAALLAKKAGRPVKIVYDRHEDMLATTKRHPARIRHRTAVKRDGTLVAQDVEVLMDGGAYLTLSPVVLSRGTLHATGSYDCPNVRIRSRVVATNTPPNGAFRGFGAPQTLFAAELHMERVAEAIGVDPVAIRRRNVLREGSTLPVGQVLHESVGADKALDECVKRSHFRAKRREYARWNWRNDLATWKGIGLAIVHHGSGFTGSGETNLASRAAVALTREGAIHVLSASTEFGQGTNTMFAQVAADTLGVPYDWVAVETPDTSRVPDSGPTVASRTCMVVGRLVRNAAQDLKNALLAEHGHVPRTRAHLRDAAATLCGHDAERRFEREYERPAGMEWDEDTYRGDAYEAYSYAAVAVDLEIDKATWEVKVHRVTSVQDIGTPVNPLLAEGQVIGGTTQALGYALFEAPVYKDGVMLNAQLTNYIIPTALDTPEMDVAFVAAPYSNGPFGAKGVGELPMDGAPPAVAAAVHNATGLWITELPVLPERIARADRSRLAPRARR